MRHIKHFFSIALLMILFLAFVSCNKEIQIPDNIDKGVEVKPIDAVILDSFIRGADVSMISVIEENSFYKTETGARKDVLEILQSYGVNWIRLRLWNETNGSDGDCNIDRMTKIARRAKKLGMKFLLDFHYSDTWADPVNQILPKAWASMSYDDVKNEMYNFTKESISTFIKYGATPDMVQIGNEITSGMMFPHGQRSTSNGNERLGELLNIGSDAVRDAFEENTKNRSDVKIMLHLDRGGNASIYKSFFDQYSTHDGSSPTICEVDFDVIGLSYYPIFNSHKTLVDLSNNMNNISKRYNKEVCIAEVSYGWTTEYNDKESNIFWSDDEEIAATVLLDSDGEVYDGIEVAIRENGTKYIPATVQNQANVIRAVVEKVAQVPNNKGIGFFYWEPCWIATSSVPSTWENQAMFDFNGNALPSLKVFGVKGK